MKRVILDTNIYGVITIDIDRAIIRDKIGKTAIIYGMPLIRKELRDAPKKVRFEGINLRNRLLIVIR